ncbi:MAG: hypothetical protein IJE05_05240 [Clostridia bacterium]|nr:hypothetical protein [Clostridia bacterium]
MKSIRCILISCLIFIVLLCNFSLAASVEVNKDNLETAFKGFVKSDSNEDNYAITVLDDTIKITVDGESYILNYDLTDKPTFSMEVPIKEGMTYEEFKNETDNLNLPMLGYMAVANIQGVAYEDSMGYFLLTYAEDALNGGFSTDDTYVIVDDMNLEDGVTIEKDENDTKTIYTSEFGNRVMEYTNSLYKDKQTISDSNEINSFTWTTEQSDVTDSSCSITSKLVVNMDADFSKLVGIMDSIGGSTNGGTLPEDTDNDDDGNNAVLDSDSDNDKGNDVILDEEDEDDTTSKKILPETGFNDMINFVIICSILFVIFLGVKNKQYKEIK